MEKRLSVLAAALMITSALWADGAGFYLPDSPWYRTTGDEPYSWTEPACASDIYPVNSILTLTDGRTGSTYSVRVNDRVELPPDRDIVLNAAAAAETGLDRVGYMSGDIEVVYHEGQKTLKDGGWWTFDIGTSATAKDAMTTMNILRANNLKPFAEKTAEGVRISVRWIPSYQKNAVEESLAALGFEGVTVEPDVNPYL